MLQRSTVAVAAAIVALMFMVGIAFANHGNFCLGGTPVRHPAGVNYSDFDTAGCVGENDSFQNTSGDWTLNGGDDQAYSAGGNDRIEGNEGDDGPLQGGTGADTIIGGLGDDVIAETGSGQGGSDTSPDTLTGNGGNDTIYGGGGADTFNCGPGSNDSVVHLHDTYADTFSNCENHTHT